MASHGHIPQESTNRKLLEQLTEQKKRMTGGMRGGHGTVSAGSSTPSTSSITSTGFLPGPGPAMPGPLAVPPLSVLPPDAAGMTSQQRTALQHALAHSVGYFITQDSAFGNLILPVLPRYADK